MKTETWHATAEGPENWAHSYSLESVVGFWLQPKHVMQPCAANAGTVLSPS